MGDAARQTRTPHAGVTLPPAEHPPAAVTPGTLRVRGVTRDHLGYVLTTYEIPEHIAVKYVIHRRLPTEQYMLGAMVDSDVYREFQ